MSQVISARALTLRLDRIFGKTVQAESLQAIDEQGHAVRKVEFRVEGNSLSFKTQANDFAYELRVQ